MSLEDDRLSEVESLRNKVRVYELLLAQLLDEKSGQDPAARIWVVRQLLENSRAWRTSDPAGYFAAAHRDVIAKYEMELAPDLGDLAL